MPFACQYWRQTQTDTVLCIFCGSSSSEDNDKSIEIRYLHNVTGLKLFLRQGGLSAYLINLEVFESI